MNDIFFDCSSLITLDLSSFNTINVEYMNFMFMGCFSLRSINLSSFNTINVINMSNMFFCCESLKHLDLSSFKTPNLVGMDCIFNGCTQLESIDMTNFTTINVKMGIEIEKTAMLTGLNLPLFNMDNNSIFRNIFGGCYSLKNIKCNDKLILDKFNQNKEL